MPDDEIEKLLALYGQPDIVRALQKAKAFDLWTSDSPIGFAKVSREGVFLRANKTLCRFLKRTETELIGTNFKSITPHPVDEWDIAMVQRVVDGKISDYILPKAYEIAPETYVFAVIHPIGFRKPDGEFDHFWVLIIPTTREEVEKLQEEMVGKVILPPALSTSAKKSFTLSLMKFASKYRTEIVGAAGTMAAVIYAIYETILKEQQ